MTYAASVLSAAQHLQTTNYAHWSLIDNLGGSSHGSVAPDFISADPVGSEFEVARRMVQLVPVNSPDDAHTHSFFASLEAFLLLTSPLNLTQESRSTNMTCSADPEVELPQERPEKNPKKSRSSNKRVLALRFFDYISKEQIEQFLADALNGKMNIDPVLAIVPDSHNWYITLNSHRTAHFLLTCAQQTTFGGQYHAWVKLLSKGQLKHSLQRSRQTDAWFDAPSDASD